MKIVFPFAILVLGLSACSIFKPDSAGSRFGSVSGNQIAVDILGETNRSVSDPDVGLVAVTTGYVLGPGFLTPDITALAYSGIAPGYDVGPVVRSGSATYDAHYIFEVVDNFQTSFFGVSGRRDSGGGAITLAANFDDSTLSGAASSLTVDGFISGGKLSGGVEIVYSTYGVETLNGVLIGYIGSTGVIGAFHGNDDDTAMAGGFVGTAN